MVRSIAAIRLCACFAALLGTADKGKWRIAPADPCLRITRRYRDNTLILETTFETVQGTPAIVDFMPLADGASELVRLAVG